MDDNLENKNEPARLYRSGGYFAKKEEKDKIAQEERRKKMIKKASSWLVGLVVLALVILPVYNYFKKAAINRANVPGEYFQSQGADHIDVDAEHPAYNSNPPSSGWHYAQPAQTGIYDISFPDEQLIHNLEHGHVWIAYKPNLSKDKVDELANLAKSYGSKIIMAPREANDTNIAFVVWEHVFKMDTLDMAQAKLFIEAYRGIAGPEKNIPDFGFKDFRK